MPVVFFSSSVTSSLTPAAIPSPLSASSSAVVVGHAGAMVRSLVEAEAQEPGLRQIPWDGRGDDGNRVSSGVYFYRIQAGETTVSNKMVVLP